MSKHNDITIIAPNGIDEGHLESVVEFMKINGSPEIRAVWLGDVWVALEGSHRLAACDCLGVNPRIIECDLDDDITDHDFFDDLPDVVKASAIVDYVAGSIYHYEFEGC